MGASMRILRGTGLYLLFAGVFCIALCSCSLFESQITPHAVKYTEAPPPEAPPACDRPYCSVDLDFPLSCVTNPKIYVLKAERRLWLVQSDTLVRDYHIALGYSPRGDKYFQGDGRTPEGEYFVCSKNSSSKYYKSMGINYPSPQNAESALSSGMISYNEYRSIKSANDSMRQPPANTALGGQVFIHGGGCYADWTLGCIALSNSAIDELFSVVQIGTPVYIMPCAPEP
jgi:lipoprotein-anchoring transpeptidase ErfK/SrfK